MSAYEVPTPKYLRVLNTIRERIENDTYPPGTSLPSENTLAKEFGVARPTVLKALGILRQDGWIESQQGKGHFVRGRPSAAGVSPQYAREALYLDETVATEILHVGPVLASPRIAASLHIPEGTPVYERRRRTVSESGPVDMVSTFVPVDVAVGTDIIKPIPITGNLLDHIAQARGIRGDYVIERLTARRITADEAAALDVPDDEPVISTVITVYQSSGEAVLASVLVMPGSRHEIDDAYPLP
ncbi:GntR family transcriptional regulator [Catenuloplanes atrovinosus]|uniref:GntR family transcriptional regulator n=1 Tax=Catenuloplanes atrovinosus TaxID=137266 RepID=A0AAE3YS84_9ACTN|nr:GntR family transcriptional regulator [Catenuloplanes atrovinosus]MDR7278690.1 GntR family transcriptional regulator [Catenuloplanes atrovinosus]